MEAPTTKPTEPARTPIDEGTWRAHVMYAEEFRGSNAEYCRRNRIDHAVFRTYKKKFGATRTREAEPKAFAKFEGGTQVQLRSSRALRSPLPDPRWTAEFIAALIAARE